MSGLSWCNRDDDPVAMIQLAMGWTAADSYYGSRPRVVNEDAGYTCGKKKHDAAVARRRKRKRGGKK